MRAALNISYGDRRLAYELCWRMTQDPDEIAALGIPPQHDVLAPYLIYVLEHHHEAVGRAAITLAALHNRDDVSLLESACDFLIEQGKVAEARELWAHLGRQSAGLIADGDFAKEPRGHGFDWRPAHSQGITHVQVSGALRVLLSGTQPESCELLRQYVALEPGYWYSLRW